MKVLKSISLKLKTLCLSEQLLIRLKDSILLFLKLVLRLRAKPPAPYLKLPPLPLSAPFAGAQQVFSISFVAFGRVSASIQLCPL